MTVPPLTYHSYLLRMWQTQNNGRPLWRASLECPQTGRRFNFADLESLFTFLLSQTGQIEPDKSEGP